MKQKHNAYETFQLEYGRYLSNCISYQAFHRNSRRDIIAFYEHYFHLDELFFEFGRRKAQFLARSLTLFF